MTVTEVAVIPLRPGTALTIPTVLTHLSRARDVMHAFANGAFTFYQCVEDPATLILIGDWPSAESHWYGMPARKKARFEERLAECRPALDGYVSELSLLRRPAGGWRVEKPAAGENGGDEEWIPFCGWRNVDEHVGFTNTDGSAEYGRIREFVPRFEVKHGRRLDL